MDDLPPRVGEAYHRMMTAGSRKNRAASGNLREQVIHNLPTPTVSDTFTDSMKSSQQNVGGTRSTTLAQIVNRQDLMPTPKARDFAAEGYEAGWRRGLPQLGTIAKGLAEGDERALLPTPAVYDMGANRTVEDWDTWVEGLKERKINGNGHGASLSIEALKLLPTPQASEGTKGGVMHPDDRAKVSNQKMLSNEAPQLVETFGKYATAIARWEQVLGRPAPSPTKPDGKDGSHRLNSEFVQWMMGLPEGWVTGVGLSRNDELKACGNGVVPQQAKLALQILLDGVKW
jgi:DNA (cytosine-5)-methyltransferase 1